MAPAAGALGALLRRRHSPGARLVAAAGPARSLRHAERRRVPARRAHGSARRRLPLAHVALGGGAVRAVRRAARARERGARDPAADAARRLVDALPVQRTALGVDGRARAGRGAGDLAAPATHRALRLLVVARLLGAARAHAPAGTVDRALTWCPRPSPPRSASPSWRRPPSWLTVAAKR